MISGGIIADCTAGGARVPRGALAAPWRAERRDASRSIR